MLTNVQQSSQDWMVLKASQELAPQASRERASQHIPGCVEACIQRVLEERELLGSVSYRALVELKGGMGVPEQLDFTQLRTGVGF